MKICSLTVLVIIVGCAAHMHTSTMDVFKQDLVQKGVCNTSRLEEDVFDSHGMVKESADLIELLELGAMYPLQKKYVPSNQVLESAHGKYTQYEERARINVRGATTEMLDILLAEGSGPYEMALYEKIYLHTIKAMNYLMIGKVEGARVEVMRGIRQHSRVKEMAEFKTAEINTSKALVKQQAEQAEINDINVDDQIYHLTRQAGLSANQAQAVISLRNSYENGFTYLLSALVFSLNHEPENARPQLKNANDITENQYVKRLFSDFRKDSSSLISKNNVFVFTQTGFAPTRENAQFPFYNPVSKTLTSFCISKLARVPSTIAAVDILDNASRVSGRMMPLADLDQLALKQYQEDLPFKITKAVLRVLWQTIRDKGLIDKTKSETQDEVLEKIVKAFLSLFNLVVNQADLRAWNMVPRKTLFYCGNLDEPGLTIKVSNLSGKVLEQKLPIDPDAVNIVWARCIGSTLFVSSYAFNR